MNHLKLFEEFDLGREEIIDFFDTELIEIKDIQMTNMWDIASGRKGPLGNGQEYRAHYSTYNLWGNISFMDFIHISNFKNNRHSYLRETEVMIVELDFYHPRMIRNSSFEYKKYIISVIKKYTERIHIGYDMNIFMYISNIDWMGDPIAKITLIILNKD
ncbi:MAG TPA: hypothetical protein PKG93_04430 [Bacilli bacterium]|nr:hypothetical protein [Bacilli bacterium]HPZ23825.1 hypothetical protein [Bacilli bacterium]